MINQNEGYATDKNSLATVDQLPQEPNNVIGRLSVKTRSRLIQEEKSGLSHQLNAKGDSFALFDTQTGSGDYICVSSLDFKNGRVDSTVPPIRASRISCNSNSSII